jgi:hypothetical protein
MSRRSENTRGRRQTIGITLEGLRPFHSTDGPSRIFICHPQSGWQMIRYSVFEPYLGLAEKLLICFVCTFQISYFLAEPYLFSKGMIGMAQYFYTQKVHRLVQAGLPRSQIQGPMEAFQILVFQPAIVPHEPLL